MRAYDRDLIRGGHYGQRSCEPHSKAEHMAAPTQTCHVRFSLPTRSRPHMAPSRSQRMSAAMFAHQSRSGNVAIGTNSTLLTRFGHPMTFAKLRILSEKLPMARQRALLSLIACLFVCVSQDTAWSTELKVFASRAIWTVLGEIGPEFEKNSGHKLNTIMGLSSEFV